MPEEERTRRDSLSVARAIDRAASVFRLPHQIFRRALHPQRDAGARRSGPLTRARIPTCQLLRTNICAIRRGCPPVERK